MKVWTWDVEALGRAVDVCVNGDHTPSVRDIIDSLNSADDRHLVRQATDVWLTELRASAPQAAVKVPEHVCAPGGCGCCPGCGDGCGQCESMVLCWDGQVGCVMPAGHDGPCVPGGNPWDTREAIERRAEPLRIAGIDYAIVVHSRTPDRCRLDRSLDPKVPDSGRWVRRWTSRNHDETVAWVSAAGYRVRRVHADEKGPLAMDLDAPAGGFPSRLNPGIGDILRLDGDLLTSLAGGWVNSGRPLPDPALRMDTDWPFLR